MAPQHHSHAASGKANQQAQPAISFTPEPPQVQTQAEQPQLEMPEWSPQDTSYLGLFGNPYTFPSDASPPAPPPIQAKLTVGAVGDKYEQEADRVAAQVVKTINSPVASSSVQRQDMEEEDGLQMKSQETIQREGMEEEELQMKTALIQREEMPEEEELQMKPTLQRVGHEGGAVTADLESEIQQARGSGQSLAPDLQHSMGQAMGADFSGVKVHVDSQSDQLNQSIQAKAFTAGSDVFFRQGEYNPGSKSGQELIAHELTHVVQQNGSAVQRKVQDDDIRGNSALNNEQKAKPKKGSDQHKFFGGAGKSDRAPTKPPDEKEEEEKLKRKAGHDSLNTRTSSVIQREANTIQRDTGKVFHMDDKGVAHDQPKRVFHMDAQGVAHEHPDPKAETSVTKLGSPGPNLTAEIDPEDFGMCDTETVTPSLNAYKEGSVWRAAVYKFEGHYSFLARLPASYYEITGPGGNTTLSNSRGQIKALHHLGEEGPDCYMVKAVDAHEKVHEGRLAPALEAIEPEMQKLFTAITVPDGDKVTDKHSAINAIEKTPQYATAVSKLRNIWDAEYVKRIGKDHDALTPAAEHGVVDPMIAKINKFRVKNGKSAVNHPPYP
ncbi:MAG: DUF4157 domain-containing protein [Cyanobacteria bacterium]|nr:DUF4157 domain-containing protein [Cyanobacteriota bacterium]MDA0865145.1 DUF4157 domain-containing protein [Cyanobacteriota bacterium]